MKTLIYVIIAIVVIGAGWFIYSKNNNSMSNDNATSGGDWAGSYKYYSQVQGANDGTTSYKVDITRSGNEYNVVFADNGMAQMSYNLIGKETSPGVIDAYYDSPVTNNVGPNFTKGKHIFSLQQTTDGIKFMWASGGSEGMMLKKVVQ